MRTNKIKTSAAALALAAAAGTLALGGGTAAADTGLVKDGSYSADWTVPWPLRGVPISVASGPATIDDGVLTIAGQSGRLTATPHGARTVIGGVPIEIRNVPDFPGYYHFDAAGVPGGVMDRR